MNPKTESQARLVVFSLLVAVPLLPAQELSAADELAQHLANIKRQVEDTSLPIVQREALALGMAGTLDRAALAEKGADRRQARWNQAVEVLDSFNTENPGHPRSREFQLQAAVYRWAAGQSWREASDLNPADGPAREQAIVALDDAITRLRAIATGEAGDVLGDNLRFRLARALADRTDME